MKIKFPQLFVFFLISFIFLSSYSHGKTVDLRNLSDTADEYEVGFCARPSPDTAKQIPGHAFVSFSTKTQDGKRTFISIGHTVQSGVPTTSAAWSYFGAPVNGYLKEENYTSAMQKCLIVKLNHSDYERVFSLTKNPMINIGFVSSDTPVIQAYKLGADDCVSFMIGVANLLISKGLNVPSRSATELPMQYMQRFISAN